MFERRWFVAVLAAAMPLVAQERDRICATTPDTGAWVSAMHAANAPHGGRLRALSAPAHVDIRNGMFIVGETPENALFDHPNDLEGKSVRFTPVAADRYATAVLPLQYDANVGTAVRAFSNSGTSDWAYARITLKALTLPLFGQSVGTIYITAFNSIALAPPDTAGPTQYSTLDASFVQQPTIAPLLMTTARPSGLDLPVAFYRESAGGIVVTWRSVNALRYDVQATITKEGEITFSYKTLGGVTFGAALITPGAAAYASRVTTVGQFEDPAEDVPTNIPVDARAVLDIRTVTVQQVSGSGVCLLSITDGATLSPAAEPRGDSFQVKITLDDSPLIMLPAPSGRAMPLPLSANISGNQLQLAFFLDNFRPIKSSTHIAIETSLASSPTFADRFEADVPLTDGDVPGVDLSASSGATLQVPIIEAFTWPTVDLVEVWERVKSATSLTDAQVDGVAIFQNFHSDVTIQNIAFATIGNAQVDGVWKYVRRTTAQPRTPNLMNLNDVTAGPFSTTEAARIVLHEFGHRWLQFVETLENGSRTISLNPAPAHPPQFASTPAAFPVVNAYDTSTMGGGVFTQAGNRFTAAPRSPYGYSWLDLYLMGLASPEEVPTMYVIDDTNPPLGVSYNPPGGITVTGTRHDITVQQVIDAMGPRQPAASSSDRVFNVLFVVVASPERDVAPDLARVDDIRRTFVDNFSKATGRRGSVDTLYFPPSNTRQRAVRP